MTDVDDIQARRAERRAKAEAERQAQYAADLAALDALEEKHGVTNIAHIEVPFTPGFPTLIVARTPAPSELKRYRDRTRRNPDGGAAPDTGKAAEELATVCLVYPEREQFAGLLAARPGIGAQLGLAAIGLAVGDEGKS